eukprot:CAMPEP_0119307306 /NCGR_PEP_ID=MMETSP1333-20130426/7840_1 /TAXON_ID=418940 /ORGANISM="Scyphosphaera apsteinii, Strain RCC1455" /LENGTH=230 /DNA_ID=CAMNT_0007310825 /DNA_START=59 /DNA_END=751 /DNA_ORIENTATION=+
MADEKAANPADDDNDDGVAPEEEAQVEFEPVVKLEEVKTQTHEEDETVLFKMRAKLFRWESDSWEKEVKMWKERGTGDIRFLQHNTTKKVRLLMRREKTMKICANFYVTNDLNLKENAGSDRSWVWNCVDFSEEKSDLVTLAIRMANSENAQKFKDQFIQAQKSNSELPPAADEGATAAPASAEPEKAEAADAPAADAPAADAPVASTPADAAAPAATETAPADATKQDD